jgi:Fic family protein
VAHWERVHVPPDFTGLTRADRQGGSYLRYHPDRLLAVSNALDGEVLEYAAEVSTALARLGERLRSNPLPILYSTMIRSESISSSWIEGIRENPRAIAIAQLGDATASHNASSVIRNVDAMKEAIELLGGGAWSHDHVREIHHDLLPWHRPGYRTEQVWIGGRNKFSADYAGPPHELVDPLMDDLLNYVNTAGDLPVVQAAIVHAQFETIHPFEDGNGRVGRALFHGILKRAGLVDGGVIPLSTVLRSDLGGYVEALTKYRYDGDDRSSALDVYMARFLDYVSAAASAAEAFRLAAIDIHQRWKQSASGFRSDSSIHRAVDLVVEYPVVSARFLADNLGVSSVSAQKLVKQLEAIGIVRAASGKYRKSALFQADDILELLEHGAEGIQAKRGDLRP